MSKKATVLLATLFLLAITVWPAFAATSAESVNLPGWIGWLLAILAIVLMVGARFFFLNRH